jgi:hypothetical protein
MQKQAFRLDETLFFPPLQPPKNTKNKPQNPLKITKMSPNPAPRASGTPFSREIDIQTSKTSPKVTQGTPKEPQTPPKIGPKPPQNPLKNTNEKTIAFGSVFSTIFLVFGPQKPSIFHQFFRRVKIKNALKFKAFLI